MLFAELVNSEAALFTVVMVLLKQQASEPREVQVEESWTLHFG